MKTGLVTPKDLIGSTSPPHHGVGVKIKTKVWASVWPHIVINAHPDAHGVSLGRGNAGPDDYLLASNFLSPAFYWSVPGLLLLASAGSYVGKIGLNRLEQISAALSWC
jgi:hypothetical protein